MVIQLQLVSFKENNKMDTCNLFRFLSCDTWKRIRLARHGGFKIYETTVTQNILYYFYLFSLRNNTHIELYESTNEKTNGNDLEIVIKTSNGYVKLPTQAKIIYSNNKYNALKHKNQVHDLIRYSSSNPVKGIPLYLIYNYYGDHFTFPSTLCGVTLKKEDHGCTISNAYTLRDNFAIHGLDKDGFQNWIIPSFKDLHPNYCTPFWRIVCCHSNLNTLNNLKEILKVNHLDLEIRTYTREQLQEEGNWRLFLPDNDDGTGSKKEIDNQGQIGFNPKYRIMIDR